MNLTLVSVRPKSQEFELESSSSRCERNTNRRILVYLRIWILNNNEEVGLYRQTLVNLHMADVYFQKNP